MLLYKALLRNEQFTTFLCWCSHILRLLHVHYKIIIHDIICNLLLSLSINTSWFLPTIRNMQNLLDWYCRKDLSYFAEQICQIKFKITATLKQNLPRASVFPFSYSERNFSTRFSKQFLTLVNAKLDGKTQVFRSNGCAVNKCLAQEALSICQLQFSS